MVARALRASRRIRRGPLLFWALGMVAGLFWVVPFLMKQDVIPGHTNAFQVTPNKEGTFLGKCAELCGVDHSRMLFNVKVVSPERYEQHLKDLAKKGQTGYVPAGIAQTSHEKNRETNNL